MYKNLILFFILFPSQSYVYANNSEYLQEYNGITNVPEGTIHTINLKSSWCGNIGLSTLVGYLPPNGECIYEKETTPHAVDECGLHYLNGKRLEAIVGPGYTCAATHAHSVVFNIDGYDSYELLLNSNSEGHYVGSRPAYGEINLNE